MMKQLTRWQKVVAYSSLVFVLLSTVFGLYTIWLLVTRVL